ncbi:MAG TPA: AraC family transcriptional regulator [Thermoleophilaceae bacterium]|nr:AraC family transcriptional regulator [Thermoleophilaceae bacterium]
MRVVRLEEMAESSWRATAGSFALAYAEAAAAKGSETGPSAGDALLTTPAEHHGMVRFRHARGWLVLFRSDALAPPSPAGEARWLGLSRQLALMERSLSVPVAERGRWASAFASIRDELRKQPPGFAEHVRCSLTLLLIQAVRLARPALTAEPEPVDPVLRDVFDFIDANYRRPISLNDVSRAVGRSPDHLTRAVRGLTGRTVMEWITDRRMSEARRVLVETDCKVDALAELVGYGDASYFRRRFRREHGMSPQVWRLTNR